MNEAKSDSEMLQF